MSGERPLRVRPPRLVCRAAPHPDHELPDWIHRPFGPVDIFADGSYQRAEAGGIEMLQIPVFDEIYRVIDFLAWRETDPFTWYRRRCEATLLGAVELARCRWGLEPTVYLVDCPADWVMAGGLRTVWAGIDAGGANVACILDWNADIRLLLAGAEDVQCANQALRSRLQEVLEVQGQVLVRPGFRLS